MVNISYNEKTSWDGSDSDIIGSDFDESDSESKLEENVDAVVFNNDKKQSKERDLKSSKSGPKRPKEVDSKLLNRSKIFLGGGDGSYGNGGNVQNPEKKSDLELLKKLSPTSVERKEALDSSLTKSSVNLAQKKVNNSDESYDARLSKYSNLLSSGTAVREVRRQMELNGESKEMIKDMMRYADNLGLDDGAIMPSNNVNSQNVGNVYSKVAIDELKSDPVLGKYAKMASMGIPAGNIRQKMMMDHISDEIANVLMKSMGALVVETNISPRGSVDGGQRSSNGRKASVPLLKMHWNTIPAEKLGNSIWASNSARDAHNPNGDDDSFDDIEELEKLFGSQSNTDFAVLTKSREIDPRLKLLLLDPKRAQNIVIGLSQFKSLAQSHDVILEAVCRLDSLTGKLNVDNLGNLQNIIPTATEMKMINQLKDSKHPAEVFYQICQAYYPDLPRRLKSFIVISNFEDVFRTLIEKMNKLIDCCNEVLTTKS